MQYLEINGEEFLFCYDSTEQRKVHLYKITGKIDLYNDQKKYLIEKIRELIKDLPKENISQRILNYIRDYPIDTSEHVTTNEIGRELNKLLRESQK